MQLCAININIVLTSLTLRLYLVFNQHLFPILILIGLSKNLQGMMEWAFYTPCDRSEFWRLQVISVYLRRVLVSAPAFSNSHYLTFYWSHHISERRLPVPDAVVADLSATFTGFTESNSNLKGRSQATARADPSRSRTP